MNAKVKWWHSKKEHFRSNDVIAQMLQNDNIHSDPLLLRLYMNSAKYKLILVSGIMG